MYSPKIREDLIRKIYRAAKRADVSMTVWVNEAIKEALSGEEDENRGTKENDSKKEETKP